MDKSTEFEELRRARRRPLVLRSALAVALALGIPAGLALDRATFPGKGIFRLLVLLPLVLPGIITGLSLLMLFREADVKLSLATVILGHGRRKHSPMLIQV